MCVRTCVSDLDTAEWQELQNDGGKKRPHLEWLEDDMSGSFRCPDTFKSLLLCPSSPLHENDRWKSSGCKVKDVSTVQPHSYKASLRSRGWAWPAAAHCPSSSCPAGDACTAPRRPASGAVASSCSQAAAGWTVRQAGPVRSRPHGAGSNHNGFSGP